MNSTQIFIGTSQDNLSNWKIINDGVMGGVSKSSFSHNPDSSLTFKGNISLENNGGFCSVQMVFKTLILNHEKYFSLHLKGDGKKYQFRVKSHSTDDYSYCYEFQTTSDWQTIQVPFSQMQPAFRGKKLDIPNFDGSQLEQIAFLIGNKKVEFFELCIKTIKIIK